MANKLMAAADARERLLEDIPVRERRLELEGVSTTVLEGGSGAPLVLLHGPGEHAVKWMHVLPGLLKTNRVIAPDLPGHGASEVTGGPLTADRLLEWLGALIGRTCSSPPALVGQITGGAMAARFAISHGDRIGRLVLVDTLGLAPFQPAPEFAGVLHAYLAQPDQDTFAAPVAASAPTTSTGFATGSAIAGKRSRPIPSTGWWRPGPSPPSARSWSSSASRRSRPTTWRGSRCPRP